MADPTDWCERYRPQHLDEIVGNKRAVRELVAWGEAWKSGRPEKAAVILAGVPGVGKTSAALALANDLGWGVVEMNASDQRNYDAVRRVATRGAVNRAFSPTGAYDVDDHGRQLIILDEADNLFGREDRGGIRAIVETIRATKQPIILIVNDLYELTRRSGALRSITTTIKFTRVHKRSVPKALRAILEAESIEAEPGVLEALAERSGGDLRAAVNDLQSLAIGRDHLAMADLDSLGPRDESQDIFGALRIILFGTDLQEARRSTWDVPESPDSVLLWVDENLPRVYVDAADRVSGLHEASRADIYLGRAQRKQQYRLWSYAGDLMTAGVAVAKTQKPKGARFQFPEWLRRMSRSRGVRATRDAAAAKVGTAVHTSPRMARAEMFPAVRELLRSDEELAAGLTADLELDADELAFLLETKATTKTVKGIMERAEAIQAERAVPRVAPGAFARYDRGPSGSEDAGAEDDTAADEAGEDETQGTLDDVEEPDDEELVDADEGDDEDAPARGSQKSLFEF